GHQRRCQPPARDLASTSLRRTCAQQWDEVRSGAGPGSMTARRGCYPRTPKEEPMKISLALFLRASPTVVTITWFVVILVSAEPVPGQTAIPGPTVPCAPVSQRAGRELGCWVLGHQVVGQLPTEPIYWHLDTYSAREAAEAARPATGTVVES